MESIVEITARGVLVLDWRDNRGHHGTVRDRVELIVEADGKLELRPQGQGGPAVVEAVSGGVVVGDLHGRHPLAEGASMRLDVDGTGFAVYGRNASRGRG